MRVPGFSKLELQIMEVFWQRGNISIREVQEALPAPRPAYTSVQTTIYRLEAKVNRNTAHRRLLEVRTARRSAQMGQRQLRLP